MKELINSENVWGREFDISGDAKNLHGNISWLFGDISDLSGCCTRIHGQLTLVKQVTTNLDDIQKIIKEYDLSYITFSLSNLESPFIKYGFNKNAPTCVIDLELTLERINSEIKDRIKVYKDDQKY